MRETVHPRNSEHNTTTRILRATLPYRCHMLSKWKENSSPPQNNAATGARRGSQQRSETNRHARTQHHTPATTCSSPHPLCSYSTGLAARPVVTCIIYKGFVYHNYLDGVIEMEIKSLGPLRGRGEQRSQAGGARAAAIYTRGSAVRARAGALFVRTRVRGDAGLPPQKGRRTAARARQQRRRAPCVATKYTAPAVRACVGALLRGPST